MQQNKSKVQVQKGSNKHMYKETSPPVTFTMAIFLPQFSCQFKTNSRFLPVPTTWFTNRNCTGLSAGGMFHCLI